MLTTEAFVPTERADRYLIQLSRHASQMQRHFGRARDVRHPAGERPGIEGVESSEAGAALRFAEGRCLIWAGPQGMKLRLEAEDGESLRNLQDGVGKRLETLGTKGRLKVVWNTPKRIQLSTPPAG